MPNFTGNSDTVYDSLREAALRAHREIDHFAYPDHPNGGRPAREAPIAYETVEAIAKILAEGYLRYKRKQREQPAETLPAPAEPAPRRTRPAETKVERVCLTDPTGVMSEAPIRPPTQPMPPVEVPDSVHAEVAARIAKLPTMTVKQLRAEYAVVFGQAPPNSHRQNLYRRIAWEIQAQAYGQRLSNEARQYAMKVAEGTELYRRIEEGLKKRQADENRDAARAVPNDTPSQKPPDPARDPRLPEPGSFLIRKHGSKLVRVKVLESGFVYEGKAYSTLSAIAKRITGKHWNGFLFFGLGNKPKA
jgi:hypothetical protein